MPQAIKIFPQFHLNRFSIFTLPKPLFLDVALPGSASCSGILSG